MRRDRWNVGLLAGLACFAAGAFLGSATVLSAGTIGFVFAAYGTLTGAPGGIVEVDRELSRTEATIGETVDVTVTVENVGEHPIPEVRVTEVPPPNLPVVDGALAHATSLESGERDSFTYELETRRGRHGFGELTVLTRNVSGSVESEETFDPETRLSCSTLPAALPPATATMPYDGRVETDSPGEGITFHSIRKFHPSDPLSRIDWKRYARTNELSTVEYQSTRAASLVVVVDSRSSMRIARSNGDTDAISLSVHAGIKLAEHLLGAGNHVGAARYGTHDFLPPTVGHDHAAEIARFLAGAVETWRTGSDGNPLTVSTGGQGESSMLADAGVVGGRYRNDATAGVSAAAGAGDGDPGATAAGDDEPAADGSGAPLTYSRSRRVRLRRLADDAQVVFCTPMLDEEAKTAVEILDAHGHPVTVVSPDVTAAATAAGQLARVRRDLRLRSLLQVARVVDWSPDEQLATAVDRAVRRWRR